MLENFIKENKSKGSDGEADVIKYQNDLLPTLKREGFLTRDDRKVERKKVGLRKARKATQFSKR